MSGIKNYMQGLSYLIVILATVEITTATAMDNRQDDLMRELERQNMQMRQQHLTNQFDKFAGWFSPQEINQMDTSQSGLSLDKLHSRQTVAIHDFLSSALSPLGYLRLSSLIRLQKVQEEMEGSGTSMPSRLMLQHDENNRMLVIQGPTLSLEMMGMDDNWQVNSLTMAQWPSQIPPAPLPDLSSPDIHYPYIRWHESTGENILGQTVPLVIQVLNALPDMARKNSCAGEASTEAQCTITDTQTLDMETMVSVVNINAKGRYLLQRLMMVLKSHLNDPVSQSKNLMFSWAGDLPSTKEQSPQSLLLNLSDEMGLWQVLITGNKPAKGFNDLPANGIFIAFSNNGANSLSRWQNIGAPMPMSQPASQSAKGMMPAPMMKEMVQGRPEQPMQELALAGGIQDMMDEGQPTWLKKPVFLNGMALSLGYMGNAVTTRAPLEPVVEVKRDGRPHRNIRVTLSITLPDSEEPWLKEFPLNFDNRTEDYRSSIRLPASMSGKEITLSFSAHEPGTRYEGIYEYKILVNGKRNSRSL
ncbi:hypothetical protein [Parendozoicomonas sp. Alg238-R29]|uniref:hypothetical protein n=1 Tax=Parendozoicomonas sp. Alg238-R29 TaxID=2993446 RepID=UPI00248E6081|nr:hypothetical protein [Parendozoicomonas sp. Alg238-R29]